MHATLDRNTCFPEAPVTSLSFNEAVSRLSLDMFLQNGAGAHDKCLIPARTTRKNSAHGDIGKRMKGDLTHPRLQTGLGTRRLISGRPASK